VNCHIVGTFKIKDLPVDLNQSIYKEADAFTSAMIELQYPFGVTFGNLFKRHEHNLAVLSILKNQVDTKIYLDSFDPSWAVTRTNKRIFLSGNYTDPCAFDAVEKVIQNGVEEGKPGFVIYYPQGAEVLIGENIKGIRPYPNPRNYYELELKSSISMDIPLGYRVTSITPELIKRGYNNSELVENEMQSERPNLYDFFEKSFAFCTIKDDTITSWCMSEYKVEGRFEIGIETHPEYRKKGLAVQTAKACINHGLEKGYKRVGWHCWKDNLASNKTAMRLGFKFKLEYKIEYLELL
jgi:GNAT superfamily N-acetyltransferase